MSMEVNSNSLNFISNLFSGNLPEIIFFGLIPSSSQNGDLDKTSSYFTTNKISEVNLSLNGNSVENYPMRISENYPLLPYVKFLDVTRRSYNPSISDCINMDEFQYNCIFGKVKLFIILISKLT